MVPGKETGDGLRIKGAFDLEVRDLLAAESPQVHDRRVRVKGKTSKVVDRDRPALSGGQSGEYPRQLHLLPVNVRGRLDTPHRRPRAAKPEPERRRQKDEREKAP